MQSPSSKDRVVFGDEDRPGFWDSPAAHRDDKSFVFVSTSDQSKESEMSKFESRMDLFRRSSSLFTLEEWQNVNKSELDLESSKLESSTIARNDDVEMVSSVSGEIVVDHHQDKKCPPSKIGALSSPVGCGSTASDDWTDVMETHNSPKGNSTEFGEFEVIERSCHIMSQLELKGVHYEPHQKTYCLEVADEVEAKGDCMFLAIAKCMQTSEDADISGPGVHAESSQLRQTAADRFFLQYLMSSEGDQVKMDEAVKHFYFPDLSKGWNIHRTQSRKFIAKIEDRKMINRKISELVTAGMSKVDAAEVVYSDEYFAKPITNIKAYNDYIRIGGFKDVALGALQKPDRVFICKHYIVSIDYTVSGVYAVDDDPEEMRVAWGDDFMLESLSAIFARDIFVVLVGDNDALFLQYKAKISNKVKIGCGVIEIRFCYVPPDFYISC